MWVYARDPPGDFDAAGAAGEEEEVAALAAAALREAAAAIGKKTRRDDLTRWNAQGGDETVGRLDDDDGFRARETRGDEDRVVNGEGAEYHGSFDKGEL